MTRDQIVDAREHSFNPFAWQLHLETELSPEFVRLLTDH